MTTSQFTPRQLFFGSFPPRLFLIRGLLLCFSFRFIGFLVSLSLRPVPYSACSRHVTSLLTAMAVSLRMYAGVSLCRSVHSCKVIPLYGEWARGNIITNSQGAWSFGNPAKKISIEREVRSLTLWFIQTTSSLPQPLLMLSHPHRPPRHPPKLVSSTFLRITPVAPPRCCSRFSFCFTRRGRAVACRGATVCRAVLALLPPPPLYIYIYMYIFSVVFRVAPLLRSCALFFLLLTLTLMLLSNDGGIQVALFYGVQQRAGVVFQYEYTEASPCCIVVAVIVGLSFVLLVCSSC